MHRDKTWKTGILIKMWISIKSSIIILCYSLLLYSHKSASASACQNYSLDVRLSVQSKDYYRTVIIYLSWLGDTQIPKQFHLLIGVPHFYTLTHLQIYQFRGGVSDDGKTDIEPYDYEHGYDYTETPCTEDWDIYTRNVWKLLGFRIGLLDPPFFVIQCPNHSQ